MIKTFLNNLKIHVFCLTSYKFIVFSIVFLSLIAVLFKSLPMCENRIGFQVMRNNTDIDSVKVYIQYNNKKDFSDRYSYTMGFTLLGNNYTF